MEIRHQDADFTLGRLPRQLLLKREGELVCVNEKASPPLEISRTRKVPKLRAGLLTGFTLVELLVVIAVIAILMAILMPTLQRSRRQAKAIVCRSNLKQLATIFTMYNDHNEGRFPNQGFCELGVPEAWMSWMRAFSVGSEGIFCCPMATKPANPTGQVHVDKSVTGGTFLAWGRIRLRCGQEVTSEYYHGSYGLNNWLSIPPEEEAIIGIVLSQVGAECFWRTSSDVKHATSNIPLFLDSWWWCSWVKDTDTPPAHEGQKTEFICGCRNSIHRFCINRHDGFVNSAFADSSVRKVGLKELWTLKWHRKYDTRGWSGDWPEWMRNFKDY